MGGAVVDAGTSALFEGASGGVWGVEKRTEAKSRL